MTMNVAEPKELEQLEWMSILTAQTIVGCVFQSIAVLIPVLLYQFINKENSTMKKIWLLMIIFTLAFTITVHAQTNIGGTYANIASEQGWGVTVDTSHDTGKVEINIDGTAQGGDAIIWGTWHGEAIFDVSVFGVKLFVDGRFKKYTGQETGDNRDYGAAIQLPPIGIDGLDVGIGVFGRNANPFGRPNLYDDAEALGYNRNDYEGLGLENIQPPPTGLSPMPLGTSVNMLVYGTWQINDEWKVKVRAMPQLTGKDKVHQLIVSPEVHFDLGERLGLTLSGDIAFQTYQEVIERELAIIAAISLKL